MKGSPSPEKSLGVDSDDWSFENTITFVNFRLIARVHHFPRLDDLKGFW